ncbi:MAG TPA: hypothetical protein VFS43_22855 [Polyangiaceae bacterium]|nr:hypothetical protein [Polyangiaceae bacterium]
MRLFDLARNDVAGALAYWAEHRERLMRQSIPQRSSTVSQLMMLQDDPAGLRRALAERFPADFVEPLAGRRQTRPRASEGPARA